MPPLVIKIKFFYKSTYYIYIIIQMKIYIYTSIEIYRKHQHRLFQAVASILFYYNHGYCH